MKFMNQEWDVGPTGCYAAIYIGGFKFDVYETRELINDMKQYKLLGFFWQTHYACKEQSLKKFKAENIYKAIELANDYLKTNFFFFEEVKNNG